MSLNNSLGRVSAHYHSVFHYDHNVQQVLTVFGGVRYWQCWRWKWRGGRRRGEEMVMIGTLVNRHNSNHSREGSVGGALPDSLVYNLANPHMGSWP